MLHHSQIQTRQQRHANTESLTPVTKATLQNCLSSGLVVWASNRRSGVNTQTLGHTFILQS